MKTERALAILLIAAGVTASSPSQADTIFNGTAYFTYFSNQQVADVTYSYDQTTHTLTVGSPTEIAALRGADGLIFAPGGQNILVGGQGPAIYNVPIAGGSITTTNLPGPGSYHLAINGNTVYTSGPYGQSGAPLISATTDSQGNLSNIQSTTVSGADTQVTQLAFAGGQVFYTNSQPNCCGNIGTINLNTGVTTRIGTGITSAHGIVYDPFTGKLDLFGGGSVGVIDPTTGTYLGQTVINGANFDQGSPDGFGHAFIAGSNGITFIDYSQSGNILAPDYTTFVSGFDFIDDIAPLSGPGSITGGVPEPSTWAMMILGFCGLALLASRRKSQRGLAVV